MKNAKWIVGTLAATLVCGSILFIESCSKKNDQAPAITLVYITANGKDLNGATSATEVATNAVITATFSTDIKESSATSANITLLEDYDSKTLSATYGVSGKTVTITPSASFASGTLIKIIFGAGFASTGGRTLGASLERSFTTAGSFAPSGVLAHYSFENNTNDALGVFNASATLTADITYADSRKAAAGKAAVFNGTTSIIEIPNADQWMANHDFTLSFWVWADSSKHDQFVMGLGAWKGFQFEISGYTPGPTAGAYTWCKLACQYDEGGGLSDSEDNWYPGNGQTKDNGGWQGWTFNKDVSGTGGVGKTYFDVKWCHVVCTYEASTKLATMYLNGEKVKQHDFNLWPNGDAKQGIVGVKFAGNTTLGGNNFAIGFIQASGNRIITDTWADPSDPTNNHFKGKLDDIRIFSKAVTATEVGLMYNSEKP